MNENDGTTIPRASAGAVRADVAIRLDRCAEMLASGLTPAKVSKELDVKPQTVRQWLVDYPDLRAAVNAMRAEASEAAYNKLAASASEMAGIMLDGARGMAEPSQVRAAEAALRMMGSFRDANLEERIAALEAAAKEQQS